MESLDEPATPRDETAALGANGVRDVLSAVAPLARAGWFALGCLVATTVTLAVVLRPWSRARHQDEASLPYETFPFADNAGVCQEYVALATVRTSHVDATAIA